MSASLTLMKRVRGSGIHSPAVAQRSNFTGSTGNVAEQEDIALVVGIGAEF
ncbi:MAG: hypothetical protein ACE1ZA_07355 [Pseudomonadales bacterium]